MHDRLKNSVTFFVIDMEVLFIFIWNGFDLELK